MRLRKKLMIAFLAATTALTPVPARADPITLIVTAGSALLNAFGATVATQALFGYAVIQGSSLITAGLSLGLNLALSAVFAPDAPKVPAPEDRQTNFTRSEPGRVYAKGNVALGGQVIHAAVSASGDFLHKTIYHADAEVIEDYGYYLSGVDVMPAGNQSGEFAVTHEGFVSGSSDYSYYTVFRRNGTPDQETYSELLNEYAEWTVDHRGAGVSDSIIRLENPSGKHYQKIRRHGGVLGLGEPNGTRAALYGRYYDVRNDSTKGGTGTERVDDLQTWGPAYGNPALQWAALRIDPEQFAMNPDDINWEWVAIAADICDEPVTDRYGNTAPRYQCAITFDKSGTSNLEAEKRILATMDGALLTDNEGNIGCSAGKYDPAPTLVLTDEDLGDIDNIDDVDEETLTTHATMSYTEPAYRYKGTTTGVIVSPTYSPGDKRRSKNPQLYECYNHNQGCRLLWVDMKRNQQSKLKCIGGLAALEARSHRFARIESESDPRYDGIYECTTSDDTYDGITQPLILVRCPEDIWSGPPGGEPHRPNLDVTISSGDSDIANIDPADMVITAEGAPGTGGTGVRLEAVFPVQAGHRIVQIQYKLEGGGVWNEFASVRSEDGAGESATLTAAQHYVRRWRVASISGEVSPWNESQPAIYAVPDTVPTAALTNVSVTFEAGQAMTEFDTPNSTNYGSTNIYRADNSTTFVDAVLVHSELGFADTTDGWTETGLAAGSVSYWFEPMNKSDVAGPRHGPVTGTIT